MTSVASLVTSTRLCGCGKVGAVTIQDARLEKRLVGLRSGAEQLPVRFYPCPASGLWHWTRSGGKELAAPAWAPPTPETRRV